MFISARSLTTLRASAVLALALTGLAGQAAHADNLNPIVGGGLGAMAGAFIGQSMGGRDGAMIGAAVGGVAGVSIASHNAYRRQEPVRTVVYEQPYRQAPVYAVPVHAGPVYVAPAYGYRVVERVNYYPVRNHGHRGWDGHGRGRDDRSWGRHDAYRHDDPRGGGHRGWDRRD
jgi:Glycine zipper